MDKEEFTFWRFIQENIVEIPIIQRDYAQGRLGKEYLRKNFLNNIKQALDRKLPNGEVTLKLDYVYGSMAKGKLHPLDGQQRLTTLWLLHWYIAYKAGVLNERVYEEKEGKQRSDTIKDVLKKFTYETRISSREFCEKLAGFDIPQPNGVSIVEHIKNQTWFYSIWMQDPTIQSMLRMLGGTKINDKHGDDIIDGLEEIFEGTMPESFMSYWKILTSESPIVFYYLPLENFGLSDDLYVKMNARGKQLTPFENFKADLINYLRRKKEEAEEDGETNVEWGTLLNPNSGITIKMDTDWLDGIFWKNKSFNNKVDEIYYTFMNRFFWNGLLSPQSDASSIYVQKGKENENLSYNYLNNKDNSNEYNDFTPYMFANGEIPVSLFKDLQLVLDNYLKYSGDISCAKWMGNFSFIPQYEEEKGITSIPLQVKPITQIQRILFFALCKYLKEGEADEISLKRWMRVVCNLVSGKDETDREQIRDISLVRTAIEHIDKLDSHHVYESLCEQEVETTNQAFSRRWTEEINKAKQILNDDGGLRIYEGKLHKEDAKETYGTWEEIIIDAENYAFFNGSIRFLFCDDSDKPNWDDFDKKFSNAKKFFKEEGQSKDSDSCLNDEYNNAELLKLLIRYFDKGQFENNLLYDHAIFNNNASTWRYYLMHPYIIGPVHHFMLQALEKVRPHEASEKDVAENIIFLLSNTKLIDFVMEKIPKARIHWYNSGGCYALYPSYHADNIVCLDNTFKRSDFLARTVKSKKVTNIDNWDEKYEVIYGVYVNFDYGGHHFCWEINDYVYLMDDINREVYSLKDENATKDDDKYYRFNAKLKDDNTIIAEMQDLIRQRCLH